MAFGIDDAIAGIGLLGGLFGGGKEDPNIAIAKEENARRKKLYEMMMQMYQERKTSGYYDPEARVGQLKSDISTREGRQLENLAGASRIAGYRPGDSAPERMLESTSRGYNYQFNQMANELRDNVRRQEFSDLSSINSGIQPYVTEPQQQSRFGGLLQSASPYLTKWSDMISNRGGKPNIGGAVDAAVTGAGGLGGSAQSPLKTSIDVNYGFKTPTMDPMDSWKRKYGSR